MGPAELVKGTYMNAKDIKTYKKNMEYSYTLGAFPTVELLKTRPERVWIVYVHSTFEIPEVMRKICDDYRIEIQVNDKLIARLSDKENVFAIAIFAKYESKIDPGTNHLCLVSPSNMGNMGTIMRTMIAMGVHDLAIIGNGVDVFNPKTIRASMGAVFRLRIQQFDTYQDYEAAIEKRPAFAFMLSGRDQKTILNCDKPELFTLIFGNEATGLPAEYEDYATSVIIPQSDEVDSLNLTIAVGIGLFKFCSDRGRT